MTSSLPAAQPRIPKLAGRNRTSLSLSQDEKSSSRTPNWPIRVDNNMEITPMRSPTTRSRRLSGRSNRAPKSPIPNAKQKKGSSLWGFLTVKEPSHAALDRYAAEQKKQIAEKGGWPTAVGMLGVSSQKLPPTVPKVNSKWDGLPELAKSRASSQDGRKSGSRSVSTRGSSRPQSGGYNNFGFSSSLSSTSGGSSVVKSSTVSSPLETGSSKAATSIQSTKSEKKEVLIPIPPRSVPLPTKPIQPKHTPLIRSPSTTTLPEITYFFPPEGPQEPPSPKPMDLLEQNEATKEEEVEPAVASPVDSTLAPPPIPRKSSARNRPPPLQLNKDGSEPTVWTPPPSTTPTVVGEPLSAKKGWPLPFDLDDRHHEGFLAGEAQEFRLPDDEEDMPHSPVPVFIDNPPNPPPPKVPQRSSTRLPLSPTSPKARSVSRWSIMSSSSSATAVERASAEYTPLPPISVEEDSQLQTLPEDDAASIAESVANSIAPSVMSDIWKQSPRERLSLGAQLKKTGGLPWGTDGKEKEDFDLNHLSIPLDKKWRGRFSRFGK